jgi:hypothetical protein
MKNYVRGDKKIEMFQAARYEYTAIVEWRLAGQNVRQSEKNLPQFHFVYHEFHMKLPGIELETRR